MDTSNALDVEKEISKLKDNIFDTKDCIATLDKKLINETFVNNAPEKLVRAEMEKKQQAINKLEKLQQKLNTLKK
ncbi:hypothetical protein HOF65_08455 [bacterium]|nr:hypothetical protein [bacterium]MBT3853912.1 hypothetical protein [bacterium]